MRYRSVPALPSAPPLVAGHAPATAGLPVARAGSPVAATPRSTLANHDFVTVAYQIDVVTGDDQPSDASRSIVATAPGPVDLPPGVSTTPRAT